MVKPGDIVTEDGARRVVVDVVGEEDGDVWVVLRAEDDLSGEDLTGAYAEDLEVIGHIDD